MGVSALRLVACAGVLVGGLVLGDSAGTAFADPGDGTLGPSDRVSSKRVNSERHGLANVIHRIISEHRKHVRHEKRSAPKSKVGSDLVSGFTTSEPIVATLAEISDEPAPGPELAPDGELGVDPVETYAGEGADGADPAGWTDPGVVPPADPAEAPGGGSAYGDNVVVTDDPVAVVADEPVPVVADEPVPVEQLIESVQHPFLYYLLEIRRGGGGWWNATMIISPRQEKSSEPEPKPEPEPPIGIAQAPQPAFRGPIPEAPVPEAPAPEAPAPEAPAPEAPAPEAPAPEAPAPEPVLDASGGIANGGSDYQATGFGGAPVLSAPIVAVPVAPIAAVPVLPPVAVPVLPPAAARFPAFAPATPSAPGVGSTIARGTAAEPARGGQAAGPQEQQSAGTVKPMSRETAPRGYTDYLRRPGLPQLAAAALPGVAGIVLMTLGGGVIGYRQANAGRMIQASGAARYLP